MRNQMQFGLVRAREAGTMIGLAGLCFALALASPYFLTVSNLINVLQQTTIIGIVAAGMTFVIISRGIDLSVGSVVALTGLIMGDMIHAGIPVPVAITGGVAAGFVLGWINGTIIGYGQLPPFIATLGTMSVIRGAALMYAGGGSVSGFSSDFRSLADGSILGLPVPVAVMLLVYFLAHGFLTRTQLGRFTYAIGGNEEAAVLAGINVKAYKTVVYGLCGALSALAAALLSARLNSAQSIAGTMYELDAIAAAAIGGASLMGGQGTMAGTLLGALMMGVLRNGLNLLNVSSYVQQLAIGSVIIIAVFLDIVLKKRRRLA